MKKHDHVHQEGDRGVGGKELHANEIMLLQRCKLAQHEQRFDVLVVCIKDIPQRGEA